MDLYSSQFSGKKKVCTDGQVLATINAYKGKFFYEFPLGDNYCVINQVGKEFELSINGEKFSRLQELETSNKTQNFIKEVNRDPYKAKDYSSSIKKSTHDIGMGAFKKHKDPFEAADTKAHGYGDKRQAYNPYQANDSILNKYRDPLKKRESSDSDVPQAKVTTNKTKKKKKDNLNDSWDEAWKEDNFNFDDMKNQLAKPTPAPVQPVPKKVEFVEDDDNSGESDAKDYEYNFFDDPNDNFVAPQKVAQPVGNTKPINNFEDEGDDFDFFKNSQSQPQHEPHFQKDISSSNDFLDLMGSSNQNYPQNVATSQPKQNINDLFAQSSFPNITPPQSTYSQNHSVDDFFGGGASTSHQAPVPAKSPQKPDSLFASDPSSVFQTAYTPQNFSTAAPGYNQYSQASMYPPGYGNEYNTMYGANYNQNYGQNYGAQDYTYNTQGYGNQGYGTQGYGQSYGQGYDNYNQYNQPGAVNKGYQTSYNQQPQNDIFGDSQQQYSTTYNQKYGNQNDNTDDLFS